MYSTGSSLLIPRFANHKRPVSAEGTLESPDPEAQAKWPSDQPGLHSSMLWVWVLSWRHSSCPGHGGPVINKRHLARSSSSAAPPVQLRYLSDHRSDCPELGPPEPTSSDQRLPVILKPQALSICKAPQTQASLDTGYRRTGPIPPAQSYLQTETRRSEVAVAKVAPGPQPPLPLCPHWPSPLSPWLPLSFPHSLPTSHCLVSSRLSASTSQ